MSRKSNRLKNRLRIECEQLQSLRKLWSNRLRQLNEREVAVAEREAKLNRSVALRMRVDRPFEGRAMGDVWQLTIAFHPQEYQYEFHRSGERNASMFVALKAREAAHQIAKVMEDCIVNGPARYVGL